MNNFLTSHEMMTLMAEASGKVLEATFAFVDADKVAGAVSVLTDPVMKTLEAREQVILNSDMRPQEKVEQLRLVYEDRLRGVQQGTELLTRHQPQILCLILGTLFTGGLYLPVYGIQKAVEKAR